MGSTSFFFFTSWCNSATLELRTTLQKVFYFNYSSLTFKGTTRSALNPRVFPHASISLKLWYDFTLCITQQWL